MIGRLRLRSFGFESAGRCRYFRRCRDCRSEAKVWRSSELGSAAPKCTPCSGPASGQPPVHSERGLDACHAGGHRLQSHRRHCCSRTWILLEKHQSSLAFEQHPEVRPKACRRGRHPCASYVQFHRRQHVVQLLGDRGGCQQDHSETLFSRGTTSSSIARGAVNFISSLLQRHIGILERVSETRSCACHGLL